MDASNRTRVYTSFDVEHDHDLHELLVAQSRQDDSGFEVAGRSQRGKVDEAWEARARRRIRRADQVVVICGKHTEQSAQVSAELRIAREEEKPYFLLWGRPKSRCTKPTGARSSDGMYGWTQQTLRDQISATLRAAQSLAAAERYRRRT